MPTRAIEFAVVPSSLGALLVAASEKGICHVRFADAGVDPEEELAREFPFAELRENPVRLEPWSDALVSYVDGHATHLEVPLDVSGSRFERRVWTALRSIPRGDTRTYAEVANSLGIPKGARAVGQACASNPVAVAIPCHRVVAKSGELGGYRWGLARKRALLQREAKDRGGSASSAPQRRPNADRPSGCASSLHFSRVALPRPLRCERRQADDFRFTDSFHTSPRRSRHRALRLHAGAAGYR